MKPGYEIESKNDSDKRKMLIINNYPSLNKYSAYGWNGNPDDLASEYTVAIFKIKYK